MVFFFANQMESRMAAQMEARCLLIFKLLFYSNAYNRVCQVVVAGTPFFSAVPILRRYLGLMLIAHLRHGEVYVPTIESTFFESSLESKKNPALAPGIFFLRPR